MWICGKVFFWQESERRKQKKSKKYFIVSRVAFCGLPNHQHKKIPASLSKAGTLVLRSLLINIPIFGKKGMSIEGTQI
jgi:hypothetical protein